MSKRGRPGPPDSLAGLTDREMQVLRLIAAGIDAKRQGDLIGISHWTVKDYRIRLKARYGSIPGACYQLGRAGASPWGDLTIEAAMLTNGKTPNASLSDS